MGTRAGQLEVAGPESGKSPSWEPLAGNAGAAESAGKQQQAKRNRIKYFAFQYFCHFRYTLQVVA